VRRPREERARRADARAIHRGVLARLTEEPKEPHASFLAIGGGLSREPESALEPAEEPREDVPPPALEALPRTPDRALIDLEAERSPYRVLHEPGDEMQPQRLEDHAGRVPVARMEEVREHAHRPLAREAEVAPDRDLEAVRADAEHLARVDAVPDDPEPARERRLAADETARWPQRRYRRELRPRLEIAPLRPVTQVEEVIDTPRQLA
jgi:hypothetical protein